METVEILFEMSGGLVLLIGFGWLIGHLLRLDKFSDDQKKSEQYHLQKTGISFIEPGNFIQDNAC